MHAPSIAPCATTDAISRILTASAAFADLLGTIPDDLIGRCLTSYCTAAEDAEDMQTCLRSVADGGAASSGRMRLTATDGRIVSAYLVVTPCGDGSLTVVAIDETGRVDAEAELAASQRRWLALLRNSTDIVFTTAPDGSLTSVTSALPERLGWATEQVVGLSGLTFVHHEDRLRAHRAWLDVTAGDVKQARLDVRLIHADQAAGWARVVISDLRDDPDVGSVIGNVTDITEQKAEEARRLLGESRFRARFEQSRLPQVMQAGDGTLESVNDAFCLLLGRSRQDLVGLPCTAIMHPDDSGEVEALTHRLRRGDIEWAHVDGLLDDSRGRPLPVRIDATLLRDADGQPSGCAVSVQDLRPLRDSEMARDELQSLFDIVAARSRDLVALHEANGTLVYSSPAGLTMFGEDYQSTGADLRSRVHPDDLEEAIRSWSEALSQSASHTWRYRAKGSDGAWMWVEHTTTNLLDTPAEVVVSTVRDITVQVESADALRVSEARYRAIADTAEEGILVITPVGVVCYANARAGSILGLDLEQVSGRHIWPVLEGKVADTIADKIRNRHILGPERYELPYFHPDGTWRTLRVSAAPMPDVDGLEEGSLAMISDVTEQRRVEQELRHAAQHDELTGLLNRSMLMTELSTRMVEGTAVLFIDLDHFKDVNDGRGHTAGDGVLVEVAARLRRSMRPHDLIARFGGDEFIVVLDGVDQDIALGTARRLLDVLSTPFHLGHHTLRIGATIGVALTPAGGAEDLLRFADTAMYAAKASGRGRVRLFDRQLAEQAEERYTLGAELLTALHDDVLEMHYQPVVDVETGEVAGVEALARWFHPTRGAIAPSRFVALAELSASSSDLDRWVIRRAMRDIAELKADWAMPEAATVAINLSGQTLSEGVDSFIIASAEEAGLEPGGVTLEITESAIMADKDIAVGILQRLRDHGFGIAIDDFGTGYSSMAYLRDLPITILKIDRGFVKGIPDDAHSLAIVTSLIELARSLDLTVVAEGVETPDQLTALRALGCPLAQGWLWSPAISSSDLKRHEVFRHRFDMDALSIGPGGGPA